jgi:hypothetical protein
MNDVIDWTPFLCSSCAYAIFKVHGWYATRKCEFDFSQEFKTECSFYNIVDKKAKFKFVFRQESLNVKICCSSNSCR